MQSTMFSVEENKNNNMNKGDKMKLGIVGSRRRATGKDLILIKKRVEKLQPEMIISGGCSEGADHFAEMIARGLGIPITIYHPKLEGIKGYHEVVKAMYARNLLIAQNSDHLIALVAPDRKGGTEDTIKHFKKRWHMSWEEKLEIL